MSVKPPPMALALSDGARALVDISLLQVAKPLLRKMPGARDKHSVMVIPGFLGDDRSNAPLIRYLRHLGYIASGWSLGQNLGPESFSDDALRDQLEKLITAGGGRISLVGHSLGGIYAREIARTAPQNVRQVITMGSPFGRGHSSGSLASTLYNRFNPKPDPHDDEQTMSRPPPVPTAAIYTKGDGVVNWRTSLQEGDYANVQNIEVIGSHIGLCVNPAVWYWIARILAKA